MALQDRFVGKNLGVKFEYGGTVISIDGDQTSFDVTHGVQSAEITAGTDGGVWEIKTLEEITYSLSSFYLDDLSSNDWGALDMGLQGTLTYAPDGFTQGTVFSSRVFVNAKPESISFNDGVVRNVEFGGQGQLAGPFLFLDNFTVADAAPLSDPKLADVLGSWDVTDTGNNVAVAGGLIDITDVVTNYEDPRLWSATAFTVASGLALFVDTVRDGTTGNSGFGFADANTGNPVGLYLRYRSGSPNIAIAEDLAIPAGTLNISTYSAGVRTKWAMILRAAGAYIVDVSAGHLLGIVEAYNTSPVYISIGALGLTSADHDFDTVRVAQLPAAKIPSPALSDDFGTIPTINAQVSSGAGAVTGTPVRVGLGGNGYTFDGTTGNGIALDEAAVDAIFDFDDHTCYLRIKADTQPANTYPLDIWIDSNNGYDFRLGGGSGDRVQTRWEAGGIQALRVESDRGALGTGSFSKIGMTVSKSNDRKRTYINGTQHSGDQTGLGTWSGGALNHANLGGLTVSLNTPTPGTISDLILGNDEATSVNIATLDTKTDAGTLTTSDLDTIFPTGWMWFDGSDVYISDGLGHLEADGSGANKTQLGPTVSYAANKAYIAPLGGDELVTNGDFTAWTADDPDGWTVTEVGDATSNVTENPAGELQMISDGTVTSITQAILTAGQFYRITVDVVTVTSGQIRLRLGSGVNVKHYTGTGVQVVTGIGEGTNLEYRMNTVANVTIDDVSVQQLALADILGLYQGSSPDVYLRDDLTITDDSQAGIATRWDSATSPASGIIVYFDRAQTEQIVVGKYVSGTYSEVSATAATYSAGAKLEVRCIGSEVHVIYNSAHIVTDTISDSEILGNTLHGIFGTENATTHENHEQINTKAIDYSVFFTEAT
jgi:hypothetical protein